MTPGSYRVGLVCSGGGHLAQMMALRRWWSILERFWVVPDQPDTRALLADERVHWAHHPTTRSVGMAVRNARLARRVLTAERPDVLVSTGAGVAPPFLWVGRLLGIPSVFVEVYDRIDSASLSGRLVRPVVDAVVLQWEEQLAHYPEGVVVGPLL